MSAPEGNQFWKLRSKHGRDLIFSSPTLLWEACCEYFEVTDSRKWVKKDWVGKDAFEVNRETETPYLWQTLFLFLGIHHTTWEEYEKREGFTEVCTRVSQIITGQKLEGAIVGAFNPQLVARIEKIKEQTEVSGKVTNLNYNAEMTPDEVKKISDQLEKDV